MTEGGLWVPGLKVSSPREGCPPCDHSSFTHDPTAMPRTTTTDQLEARLKRRQNVLDRANASCESKARRIEKLRDENKQLQTQLREVKAKHREAFRDEIDRHENQIRELKTKHREAIAAKDLELKAMKEKMKRVDDIIWEAHARGIALLNSGRGEYYWNLRSSWVSPSGDRHDVEHGLRTTYGKQGREMIIE